MEINRVSLVLFQAPLLTLHVAGVRHSATLNLGFFIWGNRVPSYNRMGGEREMEWQMWECFVRDKTSITPLHSGEFLWSSDRDFQLPSALFHVVVSQVSHICMFKTDSWVPTHIEFWLSLPTVICLIPSQFFPIPSSPISNPWASLSCCLESVLFFPSPLPQSWFKPPWPLLDHCNCILSGPSVSPLVFPHQLSLQQAKWSF